MDSTVVLSDKSIWRGSLYQLSMQLGPVGQDPALCVALSSLWSAPGLIGPWPDIENIGDPHHRIDADHLERSVFNSRLFGILALPTGQQIGCHSTVIRIESESDWLNLAVPYRMFREVFVTRYPLSVKEDPWLSLIDESLAEVADAVYRRFQFQLAAIGEEISGHYTLATLSPANAELGGLLLPEADYARLAPKVPYQRLSSGLRWRPYLGEHIRFQ